MKTLIYSCVFFNEKYIDLVSLLLKSYKDFGDPPSNVDYLIICNPSLEGRVRDGLYNPKLNVKTWSLDLKTKFEAGYSRLRIFDYPDIDSYNKILYLDCDILITNSINNMLNFELENKLYALKEGYTHHSYWGGQFFDESLSCEAFTSGVLLFNNNNTIRELFSGILSHINNHIASDLPIPFCLDQPFIVYRAIKNNLYNNSKLSSLVINNPNEKDPFRLDQPKTYTNQCICHFPGTPGHYESKIAKMTNFMNYITSQ